MTTTKANVLLLFSDQHNAGTLGCEGHPDVRTPHLDALAASGTRFERAYCQDAICLPSRCSMFSGLYPRTLGCLTNGDRTPVMDEVVSM
ncbi:MAG: sulfatase-like hydrolase/transferase, partial [Lentisphaerae bacterium]|nr:sulfatase-like hydrolase/transferase [Lentisphaerota bacterium]